MGIFNQTAPAPTVEGKKEKQKAHDEARRAARKEALGTILAFLATLPDLSPEMKTAIFALKPLRNASPTIRETMQDKLLRLFNGSKSVTGRDVYNFEDTRWGVSDMRRNMLLAIKTGVPEKRLWIEYNGKEDVYSLLGVGKDAPLGWMGYVPVDVSTDTGSTPKA